MNEEWGIQGVKLKEHRVKILSISIREASRRYNIDPTNLSRMERGLCNPKDVYGSYIKRKGHQHHGDCKTSLYRIWAGIKRRCYDPMAAGYKNYGGKGITMFDGWKEYIPFKDWATNNGYFESSQIDRINNSDGYHPNNCRFVTTKQQARNRTTNHIIEAFGERKPICDWVSDNRCSVNINTFYSRLRRGWPAELAITKERRCNNNG